MVQKSFPTRGFCRPNAKSSEKVIDLSYDGSKTSRRRRASSVTEDSARTELTDSRRTRMKFTPVNARECRLVPDSDELDTASESGQAHDQLKAGCRGPILKKERRSDSSPLQASSIKWSPAMKNDPDDGEDVRVDDDDDVDTDDDDDDADDDADDLEHGEIGLQPIRVDKLGRYYDSFFSSLPQSVCKEVLTMWIDHCHPKKRSHHAYNGSNHDIDPQESEKQYGYLGHHTMPYYWPSDEGWQKIDGKHQGGVRHKGPHHLIKEERLILLPHLLRWQGIPSEDIDFSVDNLEMSTEYLPPKVAKNIPPGMQLKDLYEARRKEIEFEREEIDGDFPVYVRMPTKQRRKSARAAKPAAKTARPAPKSLRKRSEQTDSISPNSRIVIDLRIGDDSPDLVDDSKSNVLKDASSLAEDPASEASYDELMSRNVPNGLRFDSHPNVQSHDINSFGPPSMGHDVRVLHRSSPPRPMVTRMERMYNPTFSSSSSGFVGWQADDEWVYQPNLLMYPTIADPRVSHLPSTMANGRFITGYGDGTPSGVPQLLDHYTIGGHQVPAHPNNSLHEDGQYLWQRNQTPFGLQTFDSPLYDYPRQQPPPSGNYQRQQPPPSGMDTPPPEDYLGTATASLFPGYFDPHTLSGTDYKIDPYFQGHHPQF